MINYRKYLFVLVITVFIFTTAFWLSSWLGDRKVDVMRNSGDNIAIDILSLETQFELLKEASCSDFANATLSDKLNELGDRLSYAENQRGVDDDEVLNLKKYYSILEIKDFIVSQKISKTCNINQITILYFYSNKPNCTSCTKQGFVLTKLRELYPSVRIYTFDYDLKVSALDTLISMYKIEDKTKKDFLPAMVINNKTVNGYKSLNEIITLSPELTKLASSTDKLSPPQSIPTH